MSNNNWKQMRRLMWIQIILLGLILLNGCSYVTWCDSIEEGEVRFDVPRIDDRKIPDMCRKSEYMQVDWEKLDE